MGCIDVEIFVLFQGIFVAMWVNFKVLTYNRTYHYPWWGQALGMCLAFASMIWIPIIFIYKLASSSGTLSEVCFILLDLILI